MKSHDVLLAALLLELERTRRRRTFRRRLGAGAAVASLVTLVAGIAFIGSFARTAAPLKPVSIVQSVTTASGLLTRLSVSTADAPALTMIVRTQEVSLANIEMLDDRELCAMLASIGRPAGIVRSQGNVWLTSVVIDAELPQGG